MKKKLRKLILMAAACAGMWAVLSVTEAAPDSWGKQVARKDSLYNAIFVYQRGPITTLRFGRRAAVPIQTQVNLDDLRRHMLEYTELTYCGLLYQPHPQRILVLGLGGGVIPRDMRHYFPEAQIDVVEIDEAILPLAKQYFAFQEDEKLKVHVEDGRMFIKKLLRLEEPPQYDYIILDAFNGDYIPFHLMTREFLEEVKGMLAAGGVVVANVFSSNLLFDAEYATFLDVFGRCHVYMGRDSSNAMLVSTEFEMPPIPDLLERAHQLQEKHRFAFSLISVSRCIKPNLRPDEDARVLTDDRAPVNWLRQQQRDEN